MYVLYPVPKKEQLPPHCISTTVASGLPTKVEAFTDVNSPLPAAVYLNSYPAPLNGVKRAIDAKSVHLF